MSYCIATSIVLKQNEITVKGGDNNVVPRDSYTIRIERTPENERAFVKELLGGCIRPTASCGNYFWKWITNRLAQRWEYESSERDLDAAFAMLKDEYSIRNKAPKAQVRSTPHLSQRKCERVQPVPSRTHRQ